MRFSPQFLDEIRSRLALSSVVGQSVPWDKRKSNPGRGDFWACCPFHGEKSPSFHVDDKKGFYHCFGCGVSGDHIRFLTDKEGLSFPEAVERLADLAGMKLPPVDARAEQRDKAEAGLHEVMEMACRYFEANLQGREGASVRGYLQNRRMGPQVQQRFRLGYALPSRNGLKEHLAGKGVSLEAMVEAGLLVTGEDIPVAFDRFRERVIFPITDSRDKVIAFGGRALSADAQAKYLNSPETPLFQKGALLYNFAQARRAAEKAKTLIVVEGYVDTIACVIAGFGHTVAPLGTALTDRQLALLWRVADEPILCFDGDPAGQRAARRAADLALPLLQPGKSLRFATLPEGQDPDDLIGTAGAAALGEVLAGARPLVEAIWLRESESGSFETPERRAELERRLSEIARLVGEPSVRRHYEQAFTERARGLFAPAVPVKRGGADWRGKSGGGDWRGGNQRGGLGRASGPSRFNPPGAPIAVSDSLNRLARRTKSSALALREVVIVMTAVNHPSLVADRLDDFAHLDLAGRELEAVRRAILEAVSEAPSIESPALRRHLDSAGLAGLIARLDAQLGSSGTWQALAGAADRDSQEGWIQAIALQKKARTLHKELKDAEIALAAEPSEANLARMVEIQRQLASAEGTEALIEGFGTSSGRQARLV